jgi:hypothetical protein
MSKKRLHPVEIDWNEFTSEEKRFLKEYSERTSWSFQKILTHAVDEWTMDLDQWLRKAKFNKSENTLRLVLEDATNHIWKNEHPELQKKVKIFIIQILIKVKDGKFPQDNLLRQITKGVKLYIKGYKRKGDLAGLLSTYSQITPEQKFLMLKKEVASTKEVALIFGVKQRQVQKWINQGVTRESYLDFAKQSSKYRYLLREFSDFQKQERRKTQ